MATTDQLRKAERKTGIQAEIDRLRATLEVIQTVASRGGPENQIIALNTIAAMAKRALAGKQSRPMNLETELGIHDREALIQDVIKALKTLVRASDGHPGSVIERKEARKVLDKAALYKLEK